MAFEFDVPESKPFDPDPIYTLGNAWITFGDLLDEQAAVMAGAEFGLTSGAWVGDGANSMSAAFQNNMGGNATRGGLRTSVEQCAAACWELGEQINYFAMLRNEQAIAAQKLAIIQLLAGVLGAVLGLLSGVFLEGFAVALGAVLANVASRLGSMVSSLIRLIPALEKAVGSVTQAAARITAGIGDMYAGAVSVIGKTVGFTAEGGSAAAGAGSKTSWALVAGRFVVYGTDFIANNAVSTAAANAIVGVPTDWKNWKPVPTDAEGWLNFVTTGLMLFPLMAGGARLFHGPSDKFTGWSAATFDKAGRVTGGVYGAGPDAVNSKTNDILFPEGAGKGGGTAAGPNGTATSIASGARPVTNSHAGGGFVQPPVTIRNAHTVPAHVATTDTGGPAIRVSGGRTTPDFAGGTDVSAPSTHVTTPDGIGHPQAGTPVPHGDAPRVTVGNGPADGVHVPATGHGGEHLTATDPGLRTPPDGVGQAGAHAGTRPGGDPVGQAGDHSVTHTGGDSAVRTGPDSVGQAGDHSVTHTGGDPAVHTGGDPATRTGPDSAAQTPPDPLAQAGAHPVTRPGGDPVTRTGPDPAVRTGAGAEGGAGRAGAEGGTGRTTGGAPADSGPASSRPGAPAQRAAGPVPHGETAGGPRTAEEVGLSGAAPHGDARSQGPASTGGQRTHEPASQAGTRRTETAPPAAERPGGASDAAAHRTDPAGGRVASRPVEEAAPPAGTSSRAGDPSARPAATRGPLGERGPATTVSEADAGARSSAERPSGPNTPARTPATTSTARPSRNDAETSAGAGTVAEAPAVRTSRSALTADAHEGHDAHAGHERRDAEGTPNPAHDAASALTAMASAPGLRLHAGPEAGRPAEDRGPGPAAGRESQDPVTGPRPDPVHENGPGSGSGSPHGDSAPHEPPVQPSFVRRPDGRYLTEADGLLDLGDGRPPVHVPAGSEGVFDASRELRFVQLPKGGGSFDRFLDGGWVSRTKSGQLITVKMTHPVTRGSGKVLASELILDKGLKGDRKGLRALAGPENARLVRRLVRQGVGTAKPVAIRNTIRTADGRYIAETLVPDGRGGWHEPRSASDWESVQAGLAAGNRAVGAARTLFDIAGREGLHDLPHSTLHHMLLKGSEADRIAATYALVARATGKTPRWTQVAGAEAFGKGMVLNMAAGEGKSLVFLVDTMIRAADEGVDAVHVITTRENLANREAALYRMVLEPLGYKVHRMNHSDPPPPVVKGQQTVYIGTGEDVGFTFLHTDALDGRPAGSGSPGKDGTETPSHIKVHALIDEIDEATVYSNTQYILSEGPEKVATRAVIARVTQFKDLAHELPEELLMSERGERSAPGELTEAAQKWLEQQLGRAPRPKDLHRLNMAVLAKDVYKEGVHYVLYDRNDGEGTKLYIIDQVTHEVMYNPKTSTQSRWNEGLAQAIEAEKGITIHGDSLSHKSETFPHLLDMYDQVVGASGTAAGKSALFGAKGLSRDRGAVPIHEQDRYYHSLLERFLDVLSPSTEAKVEQVAADAFKEHVETGRPQVVIAHRNDLVAKIAERIRGFGAKDVVEIDARWMLEQGKNREEAFEAVVNEAGKQGKILVINMQGARGVDIPVGPAAKNLGGLHVRVTAHSGVSRDIDIQAENRVARSGDPGSVTYYVSPDDAIFQLPDHVPGVSTAVIKYVNSHQEHMANIRAADRDAESGAAGAHSPRPGANTHVGALRRFRRGSGWRAFRGPCRGSGWRPLRRFRRGPGRRPLRCSRRRHRRLGSRAPRSRGRSAEPHPPAPGLRRPPPRHGGPGLRTARPARHRHVRQPRHRRRPAHRLRALGAAARSDRACVLPGGRGC
ncbi:hypothetical protein [Streptomyces sp. NRRL F-5123]|uniref:hypothetical protein n=1 Tax=Streptomyces sp. NRRL F-5123 TaxID=1463856 RepID=UPI0004E2169A|nr:hypothetical protein [Streptomyces sp. NRRL F-5123]